MPSLKDIKRRINAVKNTRKVTQAMKLVAAARLKKTQQTTFNSRVYTCEFYNSVLRVSRRLGDNAPLLWKRPENLNCVDLIVISSDRGLCGGFNENLLRIIGDEIQNAREHNIETRLFVTGKKGARFFTARRYDIETPPPGTDDQTAKWLTMTIIDRYRSGKTAGGNIAFNRLKNISNYKPTFWNLLPIYERGNASEKYMEYIYEPARPEILDLLCAESIKNSIIQAFAESRAAEVVARMTAMDNATKNADDMIGHLTSIYNRARQEAITSELLDIVGGAEALKKT